MSLWSGVSQDHYPTKFGDNRHCSVVDIMILVCHVIKGSCDLIDLIKVSYYSANFGGYSHSGSGDTMIFVCHVTLQGHVIKVLNGFMVMSPSKKVTILLRSVAVGTMVVEI